MQSAVNTKDPIVGLAKVTDKGQVLIPLEIRNKLGLVEGTKLIVVATEGAVVLQKAILGGREPRGIMGKFTSLAKRFFGRS